MDSLNGFERVRLRPRIEREENYACIRSDSSYRMEIRYQKPADTTMIEYWDQLQADGTVREEVLTVYDSGRILSYDSSGNLIGDSESLWDGTDKEIMYNAIRVNRWKRENGQLFIDTMLHHSGTVEYLDSITAKLTYPDGQGGTTTRTIDLQMGTFLSTEHRRANGELYYQDKQEHIIRDGKLRITHRFIQYWTTLLGTNIKIIIETTEVYHNYDYYHIE